MDTTFKTYNDMTPQERLAFLEREPNLCHTSVRWLAHEAVYPGLGGRNMARDYADRAATEIKDLRTAAAEFEQKMPDTDEAAYIGWLLATLEAAQAEASTPLTMRGAP